MAAENDRLGERRVRRRSWFSPENLWQASAGFHRRGLTRPAHWLKKLNTALYHNSLPPEVAFSPDIRLGHQGFGTMIHSNVTIGRRVTIWHGVTLAVTAPVGSPHGIVIEDDVIIGARAVVVTPVRASVRVGRGARIGAGAIVTHDVPPGATVVSAPPRVLLDKASRRLEGIESSRLAGEVPDAGLSEVQAGERAQGAVRDDDMDV